MPCWTSSIQGIEPMNYYSAGGYFASGTPHRYVDITVQKEGYLQNKDHQPSVPLLSEKTLSQARRFLGIIKPIAQETDTPRQLSEKTDLVLLLINGHTIKRIDIVLTDMFTER